MTRVLVAEDEVDIRALAKLLLEMAGHEVVEAEDGESAMRGLDADEAIEVLLLDLRLPGKDGWEVLAELRSNGRLDSGLRVIVFSAQIEPRDFERAEKEGAVGYLAKPFTEAELLAAIETS